MVALAHGCSVGAGGGRCASGRAKKEEPMTSSAVSARNVGIGFLLLFLSAGCPSKQKLQQPEDDYGYAFASFVFSHWEQPSSHDFAQLHQIQSAAVTATFSQQKKEIDKVYRAGGEIGLAEFAFEKGFVVSRDPISDSFYLGRIRSKELGGLRFDLLMIRRSPLNTIKFMRLGGEVFFAVPVTLSGYLQRRKSTTLDSSVIDAFQKEHDFETYDALMSLIADRAQERIIDGCGIFKGDHYADALYSSFRAVAASQVHKRPFFLLADVAIASVAALLETKTFDSCPWLIVPFVAGVLSPAQMIADDDVVFSMRMFFIGSAYASVAKNLNTQPTTHQLALFLHELVSKKDANAMKSFLKDNTAATSPWTWASYYTEYIYSMVIDSEKSYFAKKLLAKGIPISGSISQMRKLDAMILVESYSFGSLAPIERNHRELTSNASFHALELPIQGLLAGLDTCRTPVYYGGNWWRVCVKR
jgi:hypothetical protein